MGRIPTKILLVDDDQGNLNSLSMLLGILLERAGLQYGLETASSGEEALEILKAKPGDFVLVLLDRMMPKMQGMEVLQWMLQQEHLQWVPVIFITAMTGHANRRDGEGGGAVAYIEKPFDIDRDFPVIRKALEEAAAFSQILATVHAKGAAPTGALLEVSLMERGQVAPLAKRLAFPAGLARIEPGEEFEDAVRKVNEAQRALRQLFEQALCLAVGIPYEEQQAICEEGGEESLNMEVENRLKQKEVHVLLQYHRTAQGIEICLQLPAGFSWSHGEGDEKILSRVKKGMGAEITQEEERCTFFIPFL